ncbi:MAG TPA: hypothetical protein VFG73_01650 [Rhodanobacteraceae bacterium]|nr:hypothetical protein [Rhodanobacteraceae bacterium]
MPAETPGTIRAEAPDLDGERGYGREDAREGAADEAAAFGFDAFARITAAWAALRELWSAVEGVFHALFGLAGSEWKLAKAALPWVVVLGVLLGALALTLWLTLVALLGWGLYVGIGSLGWTLAAVVGVHLVVMGLAALVLRRTARMLTMPATRTELHDLAGRARHAGSSRYARAEPQP